MSSKKKHGLSAEKKLVSAYVGSSKNLKDLRTAPEERQNHHQSLEANVLCLTYRVTSLLRNRHPHQNLDRALRIGLP